MPKRAVFRLEGTQPTMIVGYPRTSTTDQAAGLAAQERDLTAAGAERIFGEQISSTAKRAKLVECLAFMRDGDV
jgi:DNA invertase Pin-like site-specific DNA recombinase